MNKTRLAIAGAAIVAGGIAAMLAGPSSPPPPSTAKAPVIVQPNIAMDGVLVASRKLEVGKRIAAGDLRWAEWPRDSIPSELIRRSSSPKADQEFNEAITRSPFYSGEPIIRDRLAQGQRAGFLSASLSAGKRAVSITTDGSGATSAGGFILPNDRVDLISTSRDPSAGADGFQSRILLADIRVLAIGQIIQERNGEKFVNGSHATLEVTPSEAETIAAAQRSGQITLALRSLNDLNGTQNAEDETTSSATTSMTIVRFGSASTANMR